MPDSVYACLREGFISAVDIGLLLPKTMVRGPTPGDSDGGAKSGGAKWGSLWLGRCLDRNQECRTSATRRIAKCEVAIPDAQVRPNHCKGECLVGGLDFSDTFCTMLRSLTGCR